MPTIALDFETANEDRGSACAIGLAWIEGDQVVRVEERLIRPRPFRFSGFNIQIHGITPKDVLNEPEFPQVLAGYLPDLTQALVLAHNAAFDISVIKATLDRHGRPYPTFPYLCTVKIARHVWPDLASSSLPVVARHLGLSFDHHRAGADAYACAKIAIAAAEELGLNDVSEIAAKIGLTPGALHETGHSPCSVRRPTRAKPRG